jgi:sulfatase maturation enzyme AslB (radical SAM superfamily)
LFFLKLDKKRLQRLQKAVLSAHQALSYTNIRSIPYHSISTTLKPKGFSCNLYHQYCKYLRLHTNRIP